MTRGRTRGLALALLVLAAGAAAGFFVFRHANPRAGPVHFDPAETVSPQAAQADQARLRKAIDGYARSHVAELHLASEQDLRNLVTAAADTFEVYHSGAVSDYVSRLRAQQLDPPAIYVDPKRAPGYWERSTRIIHFAAIDAEHVELALQLVQGQSPPARSPSKSASQDWVTSREGKLRGPHDVDPAQAHADVIQLRVPVQTKNQVGETFATLFTLDFARRPADGQWIVLGWGMINPPTIVEKVPPGKLKGL